MTPSVCLTRSRASDAICSAVVRVTPRVIHKVGLAVERPAVVHVGSGRGPGSPHPREPQCSRRYRRWCPRWPGADGACAGSGPATSRSSIGWFSMTSAGVTDAARVVRLEFEIDDGVDGGPSAVGIAPSRPLAHKVEVEFGFQMPIEVVCGNEVVERDGDRVVSRRRGFGGAEHGGLRGEGWRGNGAQSTATGAKARPLRVDLRSFTLRVRFQLRTESWASAPVRDAELWRR